MPVTGRTQQAAARHFRCGIKGLSAESVKQSEDFRRTLPPSAKGGLVTLRRAGWRAVMALLQVPRMGRQPLMTARSLPPFARRACALAGVGLLLGALAAQAPAATWPITEQQRDTAQKVASAGVPLSELAADAPDSYTVKAGDTLWDISKVFLKSPWHWPELWGMNLAEIRNPHLIYPGQVLVLDKSGGRARLRMGQGVGEPTTTVKLSPRVRSQDLGNGAIPSIPLHLIQPFLNEAVVFNSDELAAAPRIVAAPEERVLVSRGDLAYVLGELNGARDFRVFREATPLVDPVTHEILGYEGRYLGTAEYTRPGENRIGDDGKVEIVPATFVVTSVRNEMGLGDRLSPVPAHEFVNYVPHPPSQPMSGRIISVYGDALNGGPNEIVSLNRGAQDGMERGNVLALWREGIPVKDRTGGRIENIKLPDERHGLLFVFRVFDRVSYALILSAQEPVHGGDRFTQP
jgi:LysM repeat protein